MSAVEGAFLLVVVAVIVRVTPAAVGWTAARLADRDVRRRTLEARGRLPRRDPGRARRATPPSRPSGTSTLSSRRQLTIE